MPPILMTQKERELYHGSRNSEPVYIFEVEALLAQLKHRIQAGALGDINAIYSAIEECWKLYKIGKPKKRLILIIKRTLTINATVNIKSVNGKLYLLFKGKLTSSFSMVLKKIKVKVISFSVQKAARGLKKLSRSNVIAAICLTTTINAIEYFFKEKWFWSEFFADLGVDLVKDLISAGVGLAAGIGVAALLGVSSVAIAAGAIVVAVSLITTYWVGEGLDFLIEKYNVKKILEEEINKCFEEVNRKLTKSIEGIEGIKQEVNRNAVNIYQEIEYGLFNTIYR